jgi:exoribonuclease-2
MNFRKNDVIDYFEDRRIWCGLILDFDDRRLRVLNEQGKEAKLSKTRVLNAVYCSGVHEAGSRDEQVAALRAISAHREEIKNRIDLRELWEVIGPEASEISLEDLRDLVFGGDQDPDSAPALLRAIVEDRIYFKIRPDLVEVVSQEQVRQAITQREKERERLHFIGHAADFLRRLKMEPNLSVDKAPKGLLSMLEEAAQYGTDWVTLKPVKEVFSNAGLDSDLDPFRVLVKLGVWSEDENIRLRTEKIPVAFPPEAEDEALRAAGKPLPSGLEDLTNLDMVAIDAASTHDVDDALSISIDGNDAIVGIHITDVANFVEHDSPLDRVVRERATSIYLPDMTIPMIPPVLSEKAASLAVGEIRPAVSMMVRIGPDFRTREFYIVPSMIRVSERLSYEEADERILDQNSKEARMFAIASAFREDRVATGAIIFRDLELSVRVDKDGRIDFSVRDRENRSQILVSEMMILANSLFAHFLTQHNLPGIFRSQQPASEKIELGEQYDPVLSYRSRKVLAKGDMGPDPAPHSTLGLDCYTTATSPLRRYQDLLVQRQIKSFLETGKALLDRPELEGILLELSYPLERASVLERERTRYFLLKYLQAHRDENFEAVVLQRFPRFHLVQIVQFGLNAALMTPDSLILNPYDKVLVRIEKIRPREDKLSLSLVRLL